MVIVWMFPIAISMVCLSASQSLCLYVNLAINSVALELLTIWICALQKRISCFRTNTSHIALWKVAQIYRFPMALLINT